MVVQCAGEGGKVFSDRILSPQAVGTGAVRGTKAYFLSIIPILTSSFFLKI